MSGSDLRARGSNSDEVTELRERGALIIAAFEREEPSPIWARFRNVLEGTSSVRGLRAILRDFRGMRAGMSPEGRRALDQALLERFGPDPNEAQDMVVVAKVRKRGRIRSEREYRIVQAYADSIGADPGAEEEFLELGALLDEFSAAP